MKELKFRNLTKDEIEVRVGAGSTLLLYKTARVDANILDETVGCFNWTKRFYQVKNTMICEVAINVNYDDTTKEPLWVAKGDAGDESQTEAIKGEASDSFKRAGFAWGIGRSLYNAPKIKLPTEYKDNKFFDVEIIEYDSKSKISKLVITTNFGKDIVFQYPKNINYPQTTEKASKKDILTDATQGIADEFGEIVKPISKDDLTFLNAYIGNLGGDDYKSFFNWLKGKYQVAKITDLTEEQGKKLAYYLKNRNK